MPLAQLEPVADLRLEATLVQQAEGRGVLASNMVDGAGFGPAPSVLAERALEPADALGRVGCCRGRVRLSGARASRPARVDRAEHLAAVWVVDRRRRAPRRVLLGEELLGREDLDA